MLLIVFLLAGTNSNVLELLWLFYPFSDDLFCLLEALFGGIPSEVVVWLVGDLNLEMELKWRIKKMEMGINM